MSKSSVRYAEVERETARARVRAVLDLDESGVKKSKATAFSTGFPLLDEMLQLLAAHGHMELGIVCEANSPHNDHYALKEIGLAMGQVIRKALGEKPSIKRFASQILPFDDALVLVSIDASGTGFLGFDCDFQQGMIGTLSAQSLQEFLRVMAFKGGLTLHIKKLSGVNDHNLVEAIFRGTGIAMGLAFREVDRSSSGF